MPKAERLSDDILEEVGRLMEDFPTFAADNRKHSSLRSLMAA